MAKDCKQDFAIANARCPICKQFPEKEILKHKTKGGCISILKCGKNHLYVVDYFNSTISIFKTELKDSYPIK